MRLMNMLHLTPYQMGALAFVQSPQARIEPRICAVAPYAGHGFLPMTVLTDPEQAPNRDVLLILDIKTIDLDVSFPPTPDE